MSDIKNNIADGKSILRIEFGSTRIKAILIDPTTFKPIAQGSHEWENRLENGFWTYHLDDIWTGLQDCYQDLVKDVKSQYGVPLKKLASIGFSAMMHGYMAFYKDGNQLAQFRTWRNANTTQAAEKLTDLFQFNIPERWSISHLYQCILNKEEHIAKVDFFTTPHHRNYFQKHREQKAVQRGTVPLQAQSLPMAQGATGQSIQSAPLADGESRAGKRRSEAFAVVLTMRKLVLLLLFGSVLTGAQQFVNDTTYYTDANGRVILMINQRPIQKESVPIPILPKHSKSARTRYFENIQAVPLTADSAEIYRDQISSEYQEARHDRHLGKALIGIGCGASGASEIGRA